MPPPNETHPAYARNAMVHDWVNGTGAFVGQHYMRVPVPGLRKFWEQEDPATILERRVHTLDLHTCWGTAPYVGPPFVYAWRVAVDELGRMVAGEAWRQYLDAS